MSLRSLLLWVGVPLPLLLAQLPPPHLPPCPHRWAHPAVVSHLCTKDQMSTHLVFAAELALTELPRPPLTRPSSSPGTRRPLTFPRCSCPPLQPRAHLT